MSKKYARQSVGSSQHKTISQNLIICILLGIAFIGSLYLRIIPLYEYVFPDGWVRFIGTDPYYHMAVIENLVHNFPKISEINPYLLYPEPMVIVRQEFFDYFVGTVARLFSNGSLLSIDKLSAFIPPILASLTIIPVYFIGKSIFNKWVGVIAGVLVSIIPSEFLGRSIVGNVDHHVLESLLLTTIALFIILALKLRHEPKKSVIYSSIAGLCLACYLCTWIGGLIFAGMFAFVFMLQFIYEHIKRQESTYLYHISVSFFAMALLGILILPHTEEHILFLGLVIVGVMFLHWLSQFMSNKRPFWYPVVTGCLILFGVLVIYVIQKDIIVSLLNRLDILMPSGTRLTIEEATGLFMPAGKFTFDAAWKSFTTCGILAIVGLYVLITNKKWQAETIILIVWSIITMVMTIFMRRFAYYFTVNVAILTGYTTWMLLYRIWDHKSCNRSWYPKWLMVTALSCLVIFPNIANAHTLASVKQFAPSNAWHEATEWLKTNTPEPYNNTYLNLFQRPYKRLDSGYGIVSHWDYGYWITQMAHRSPIINPGITESRINVANYMLGIKDIYSVKDSKYVILTSETAMASGKFWSWAEYAGLDWHDYFDFYYIPSGELKILYYPEYYKTPIVRLYNFDGERVIGQEPTVITYRKSGNNKTVLSAEQFSTYFEAVEYVKNNKDCKIVSIDPFLSPVSMPEVSDYKLVFSTENRIRVDNMLMPEVKIFERIR